MTPSLAVAVFIGGAVTSLATSWVVVSRVERIGARLGVSAALLGLMAAVAADAPEITSAVSALARHEAAVGSGVVIGSNVFNLAALLGLGAVVAGGFTLHRRVVLLAGFVALELAAVSVATLSGVVSPRAGLALALPVLLAYVVAIGLRSAERPARPWSRLRRWLAAAREDEESELGDAFEPPPARWRDVLVGALALAVVIAASVAMERAATSLGSTFKVPEAVTGGVVLAAVTSLPNVVAAVYLARRGNGPALLSEALNSNALNVVAGFLLPGSLLGIGQATASEVLMAAWYTGLTLFALALAYRDSGIRRDVGILLGVSFVGFVVALVVTGPSGSHVRLGLIPAVLVLAGVLVLMLRRGAGEVEAPGVEAGGPVTSPWSRARPAVLSRANSMGSATPRLLRWPPQRLGALAMVLSSTVALCDALVGSRIILIGLLVIGPCCALLTAQWSRTAVSGAFALALAAVLGIPDGIWGTPQHFIFIGAIAVVSVATTVAAAFLQHLRLGHPR